MNEDILLSTLREIREDQKKIVSELADIRTELAISRNGFSPHEVVELLHWVEEAKNKEQKRAETIQKSIISWVVPAVLSVLVAGIAIYLK